MEKSIFTPEYTALLQLLKRLRKQAGFTQIELAEQLSITQSILSKFERGELRIDIVQLRTICQVLNITLSELVEQWEKELTTME